MALDYKTAWARLGRYSGLSQDYFEGSNLRDGYSTVASQQNPNPVYTYRHRSTKKQGGFEYGEPVKVYKADKPVAAAPAAAEETNNEEAAPSYIPTPIDVGQVDTNVPTTQTQTNQNTQEPFDTTPYDNIISQLSSQISSITQAMQTNTTNFNNQMAEYGKRFNEQQAAYDKNLTSMRNTLLASNQPQREPVLGIKGAADKGNAQIKQLGRQGMKGTFSREGLRIKNINV